MYSDLFANDTPKLRAFYDGKSSVILIGDANCDGIVSVADVVAAASVAAEPNSYKLSKQGEANADVHNTGDGISASDASVIQEISLGLG